MAADATPTYGGRIVTAPVNDGEWRWAPLEPTEEMLAAGGLAGVSLSEIYRAMLSAAPPRPEQDVREAAVAALAWFDRAMDGDAGCDYLNGDLDSDETGWTDAEKIAAGLRAALSAMPAPAVPSLPRLNIRLEYRDGIVGTRSLDVVRVEAEDDGSFTAVSDFWPAPAVPDETEALRAALATCREVKDGYYEAMNMWRERAREAEDKLSRQPLPKVDLPENGFW